MTHTANAVNIESHPGQHISQQETLTLESAFKSHLNLLCLSLFSVILSQMIQSKVTFPAGIRNKETEGTEAAAGSQNEQHSF